FADDLYRALEPFATASGESAAERRAPARRVGGNAWIAGGLLAVGVIAAATWKLTRTPDRSLVVGKASQFTSDEGLEIQPAISPDGKLLAFAAGNSQRMRIFIRPLAGGRTIALSDDSTSVEIQPQWSPDGNHLLFLSGNSAFVSPVLGGTERRLVTGTDII